MGDWLCHSASFLAMVAVMNDAVATPTIACEHGEPRGCTGCALCRRGGCAMCRPRSVVDEGEVNFTLRLPADLHGELKQRAKAEDRRLAQTVRAALRAYLAS